MVNFQNQSNDQDNVCIITPSSIDTQRTHLGPKGVPNVTRGVRGTYFWDWAGYARDDPVRVIWNITRVIDGNVNETLLGYLLPETEICMK